MTFIAIVMGKVRVQDGGLLELVAYFSVFIYNKSILSFRELWPR